jgi:glycosyltransferase
VSTSNQPLKISIITAVFNRERTVAEAMESVLNQTYANIEYIVIDGMSDDGTQRVIEKYRDRIDQYVREPDKGIYDALNKGIRLATGDVIGFLHADDLLAHNEVIASIARQFNSTSADAVYGELLYIDQQDQERIIRYWKSQKYLRNRFFYGWMPPHPTCYIKRKCYEQFGVFDDTMSISADYELLVRLFVKHEITASFLRDILVKMRVGGKSNASLKNRRLANREDATAWSKNGLKAPMGLRFTKPIRKLSQFWSRPKMK